MTQNLNMNEAMHWLSQGRKIAVATVVETWGSAPQPTGSQLLIDENGNFMGAVSGGCVEGAVILEAQEVITTQQPKLLEFGVTNETAWQVGLACGGQIAIHIMPWGEEKRALVAALNQHIEARAAVAVITHLATGAQKIITKLDAQNDKSLGELFRHDRSEKRDENFIHIFNPSPQLIVIGAVLITQNLISLGQSLGYHCLVIDPRAGFATQERFPNTVFKNAWPDEVLPHLSLDSRTSLLALTHDPKIDDKALEYALKSDVFYIGALGSSKTHEARKKRLKEKGFNESELSRIHGPVGLNIGAKGAAEIALSILADITKNLRLGI